MAILRYIKKYQGEGGLSQEQVVEVIKEAAKKKGFHVLINIAKYELTEDQYLEVLGWFKKGYFKVTENTAVACA